MKLGLVGVIAVLCVVVFAGAVVASRSDGFVYDDLDAVPARSVVIVPGSRVLVEGPSTTVENRLEGALALYEEGRVEHILVSGDNQESHYNEPVVMRDFLVGRGVPAADVTLDYAGLDTWDTCLRAHNQFGVVEAAIVTQDRHANRTAALCREAGIDVVVLTVDRPAQRLTTRLHAGLRESLAKVKAVGDLVREPPARHGGPFVGLVGSVGMPEVGHPPDWNWERETPATTE